MLPYACSEKEGRTPLLPVLLLLCSSLNLKKTTEESSQKLCMYSVLDFVEGIFVRSHNDAVCTGTAMVAVLGIEISFSLHSDANFYQLMCNISSVGAPAHQLM